MAANANAVSVRLEPARDGQRAHDLRIGPQPEYVDTKRSKQNLVLLSPLTNDQLRNEWRKVKERVGNTSKIRSNQNLSYSGIITFGTEAQKIFESLRGEEQNEAFLEIGENISKRFNTDLTGMVVHFDESALHGHFQLRGIANDGTMLSQVLKRSALREVQDIAAEVMNEWAPGIERGKSKKRRLSEGEDYAATVNRSVAQLHADLPREIAEAEAKRDKELARAKKNERLAEKARLKADENDEKATKSLKLAETYEKRAADAQRAVESLVERVSELRATEDRLAVSLAAQQAELVEVKNSVAQKKTNVQTLNATKDRLKAKLQSLRAV